MTLVSELLNKKIEVLSLKLQLLDTQGRAMQAEQRALIEEARKEVNAPEGHLINTDTRTFVPRNGTTPLSAAAKRRQKRAIK